MMRYSTVYKKHFHIYRSFDLRHLNLNKALCLATQGQALNSSPNFSHPKNLAFLRTTEIHF